MKYEQPSFSSGGNSNKYVENWEKVFGRQKEKAPENQEPEVFTKAEVFSIDLLDIAYEEAEKRGGKVEIKIGLVEVKFEDGSIACFPEPLAYTEKKE